MDAIIRNLLLSILVPALAMGVSYFALTVQTRLSRPWVSLLTGLEAAFAFGLGFYFLTGSVPFVPKESTQWLIYVWVVAAIAAALLAGVESPASRMTIMIAAVAFVTFVEVKSLWRGSWQPVQAVWLTGMILAVGTIGWAMLQLIYERTRRSWAMIGLVGVLVLSSVAVAMTGSVSLAIMAGIFAAVLAPLVAIAWWRPESGVLAIAVPFTALALLGVLVNARFYSDLGVIPALLILFSPVVGWALVRFGPARGLLAGDAGRTIAMLIPAAGAVVYAILTSAPSGY
jgi:hypothetical protein